jgi:hypothetical protein
MLLQYSAVVHILDELYMILLVPLRISVSALNHWCSLADCGALADLQGMTASRQPPQCSAIFEMDPPCH